MTLFWSMFSFLSTSSVVFGLRFSGFTCSDRMICPLFWRRVLSASAFCWATIQPPATLRLASSVSATSESSAVSTFDASW